MHTPLPFHSGNFPVSGSNDCQRVSFASNRSSCIPCRSAHMTLSRSKIDERKLVVAARVLDDHRFLRADGVHLPERHAHDRLRVGVHAMVVVRLAGVAVRHDGQAEFHCGFQTLVMMPDVQHDECVDEVAFAQPTHVGEVFGRAGR